MSLSGNLKTMPFPDLLQFLDANSSTGTLQIRRNQIVKMIFFEKGKIISSSSTDPKEYLGHFLVSRGLINEDELRMAMDIQRNSKMLLGKILVVGGKVTEDQITALVKLKAEETIYSVFLWDEGEFRFFENEFITQLFIRIALTPQSLIFEGILRRDEWLRIRKVFVHNYVVPSKVPHTYLDADEEDSTTHAIYNCVDGKKTIEEIVLATHSIDYKVCKTLFHLFEKELIFVKAVLDPPAEPEVKGGNHTLDQLLTLGKTCMKKKRYVEAVEVLRQISPQESNYQMDVAPWLKDAELKAVAELQATSLPPSLVLQLRMPLNKIEFSSLTPEEGFLLSRIDGKWDVRSILTVTPMNEYDSLRLLKKLMDQRIIGVKS